MTQIDDPFADWKRLLNMSVYSIDGRKIGSLRKLVADYMVVRKGFISLTKYFIPTPLAESVGKKGIRVRVTAVEAKTKYSSINMKNFVNHFESLHQEEIENRSIVDRLQVIRYGTTRNRLAAGIAFISGILFLISGYKANLAVYDLIGEQIKTAYCSRGLDVCCIACWISCLFEPVGRIYSPDGGRIVCSQQSKLGQVSGDAWNRSGIV
jgi:hypothetical protein